MDQLTDETLNKPATKEYCFNFGGNIFGDYAPEQETHLYLLLGTKLEPDELLSNLEMPQNLIKEIEFTVKIGETLEMAVKRILKNEFGINELFKYEYRFSKTNPNLVYVKAICRNTLEKKKFRNLNLYWYGISYKEPDKLKIPESNLYKIKAIKEYFTRFVSIRSVDDEGNEIQIGLTKSGKENDYYEYCDKVRVGETLEEGLTRSLKNDFGLELIFSEYYFDPNETTKNKYGEELQRIMVNVLVKYRKIKDHKVVGLVANWVKIEELEDLGLRKEEALSWLKKPSTLGLAGNRFAIREDIEFVEKLYKIGAIKVWVENIQGNENEEDADTLVVILPMDKEKRKELFKIYETEFKNEFHGEESEGDIGQTRLTFWWD